MNINALSSVVCRVFFVGAFALLGLGVAVRLAYAMGYTLLGGTFTGWRLLEISGVVLLFVIALLLRQIREGLRPHAG